MKVRFTAACLILCCSSGIAQIAVHPCQLVVDADERASCLANAFPAVAHSPTDSKADSANKKESAHPPTLYLRSAASVGDFGKLSLGDDGAQFSGSHSDGNTKTSVDLGALLVMRAINSAGWQPFVYGTWNRDEAADPRSDKRSLGLGILGFTNLGPHTGPQRDNLNIYTSINLARRIDLYGADDAYQGGVKFDFVKLNWAEPRPGELGFMPQAGFLVERRNAGRGAAADGTWTSAYVGSKLSYKVSVQGLQGVGVTALVRWFADASVPGGNERRHEGFGKIKATYALYENSKSVVKPSVFIARQAGTDVLTGTTKAKTDFGLQFQIH